MKKTRITVPVAKMSGNSGQLEWLPKNPRQWTAQDLERTVRSIEEDPDFLEDRPPLVVQYGEKYVTFAGNLRFTAIRKTDIKEVTVVLYTPESDEDRYTIKRRAMKDNGSFGSWDFDALANEWDDMPLADWGIPAWEGDGNGVEENTAQEDNFIEELEEIHVICKKGDIWELGDHRLMCGDSIDLEQVTKLMGVVEQTS